MPGHIGGGYFPGGDGSEENPFQIKTAAQLESLAALVNADDSSTPVWADKYYKLMNDLTLTGQWAPIGHTDDSTAFKGHFDGGYHTISGLKVSASTNAGLFGIVVGGSVKNLGLVDVDIVGGSGNDAGGVAGYVLGGSVENCYVTGSVSSGNSAGGVAGGVYTNGSVKNCYSTATVSGSSAGGVAGVVGGSVENCYSTGAVSGDTYVGGVAGVVQGGSVKNCAALNPSVKDTGGYAIGIGRVAGVNNDNTDTLSGNYAFISMTGSNWGNIGTDNLDGAYMSKIQAVTPSFWQCQQLKQDVKIPEITRNN